VQRRLPLGGRVFRMEGHRVPSVAMRWITPGGKHQLGHLRHIWRRTFIKDLEILDIAWDEAKVME
ncbi:endonuclease exonuclease phosphatase family, partial [Clarias magur]